MPGWLQQLLPLLILLAAIAVVLGRLPRLELGFAPRYRHRRAMNWLPLGLTYAFLYMGRYNLNVAKRAFGDQMGNDDFSLIFGVGTWVYGIAFLLNGPLADRFGGKKTILAGAIGTLIANALMGLVAAGYWHGNLVAAFVVLYAVNMYFQSFGAVAIVKANAPWFHVRERGTFGAIFGILIALGIYFAYDWGKAIVDAWPQNLEYVFYVPAAILAVCVLVVFWLVKDTPGEAGHRDFDTGDASSGDDGPRLGALAVFRKMAANPVIMTIAFIEFCSGFLRQAIMQWYPVYAKEIGLTGAFVYRNWGLLLCVAGILGGVFAGVISDHWFQSRRGPVSAVLYGGMLIGAIVMAFSYRTGLLGPLVVLLSMCVIGVHGMLSGTASMDFGGKKNAGIAVGIIDGFVYAGTGFMSAVYYFLMPTGEAAKSPDNWKLWPISMIPIALVGMILAARIWNATPKKSTAATG